MEKKRRYFFLSLFVVLLGLTIVSSWQKSPAPKTLPDPSQTIDFRTDLEIKLFTIQTQLVIGALRYIEANPTEIADSPEEVKEVSAQAREMFRSILRAESPLNKSDNASAQALLIRKIIAAKYFGLSDVVTELRGKLSQNNDPKKNEILTKDTPLSEAEATVAVNSWGWFGKLYVVALAKDTKETLSALESSLYEEANYTFMKVFVALFIFIILAVISFLSALILGIQLIRGKFHFRFQQVPGVSPYGLEIFCLYLLGMLIASVGLRFVAVRNPSVDPLLVNLVGIVSLSLLVLWPKFFKVQWVEIKKMLGITCGGIRWFFGNAGTAVISYLALWTIIFIVIVPYSLALEALGVDLNQGAHPVVPMLLSADNKTVFLILVLGVVVAPFVEELMFRGALYSWLRDHFGAGFSIFASAVIFAAVHPQGPIGVVPLTIVGMMLAFLREWRNSLIAPMLAHALVNGGTFLLLFLFFR